MSVLADMHLLPQCRSAQRERLRWLALAKTMLSQLHSLAFIAIIFKIYIFIAMYCKREGIHIGRIPFCDTVVRDRAAAS